MTSDKNRRFTPTPIKCFFLAGFLVLIGGSFASSTTIVRERLDNSGQVMTGADGQPLVEVDQWASYWNGWQANIPITAAIGFFCLGIAIALWRLPHQEPKRVKQKA